MIAVLGPGRAGEVAAHHALERHRLGPAHQHRAARDLRRDGSRERGQPRRRSRRVRAVTKCDGTTSASRSNQNALIWVSTAPLPGIGSRITTSNALTRSLATSSRCVGVHLVDLAHLAAAQQRQRQRGSRPGRRVIPAPRRSRPRRPAAARARAAGGRYSSRNSPTCCAGAAGVVDAAPARPAASAAGTLGERGIGGRAARAGRWAPRALTASATARLCRRITSCSACRSPPAATPSMSQRSVAMNGICSVDVPPDRRPPAPRARPRCWWRAPGSRRWRGTPRAA